MTSREEDEEAVYQEEEVLWAKIRGYPWWPAFVDKVHPMSRGEEEAQYTVFFFGDNTQYFSSKLGASKLRKFIDCYTEFYQKARSHRKLMLSIQQAEKKLQQNDQNIQIFEELRNAMKVKKPKGIALSKNESRMSERDESEKIEQPPQLNKSKTYAHNRQKHDIYLELEKSSSKIKEIEIESTLKKDNSAKKTQKIGSPSEKKEKKQPLKRLRRGLRSKKQEIFQEDESEDIQIKSQIIEQPKQLSPKKIEVEPEPEPEPEEEVSQSSQQLSIEQQKSEEDNVYTRKSRFVPPIRRSADLRISGAPRKRGRPKKLAVDNRVIQKMVEESTPPKYNPRIQVNQVKRKIIRKQVNNAHQIDAVANPLSQADNQIIQTIKDISDNREELIDYLSSIDITVSNVKQILDLDVSNILQDGIITQKISDLLELMKSALLYKYFPEDIKHKKKYDKLFKKKLIIHRERISRDINDKKQKAQRKQDSSESKSKEQQIRKKTLAKLQKFLKSHPQIETKGKEMAVKIESFFEKADSSIGEKYKSMAYKVLKNLKQKAQHFSEVIKNLEHHKYT